MKKQEVMNIRGQPGDRASPSIGHSREDLFFPGQDGQYLGRQQLADKNTKGDFR